MKKGLLFICMIVSLHSLAQSYIWAKDNAVWHYKYYNYGTPGVGYIKIWDAGDVIIQNKVCSDLRAERHHFMPWGPQSVMTEFVTSYIGAAVYVSNDTVFYWDQDHFSVLYNFYAEPNDQWLLQTGADTTQTGCNDTSVCIVSSTGVITLAGHNYMELVLQPSPGSGVYLMGKANSRFGSSEGYLFPYPTNCNGEIIEYDIISFICFEDDELYYNPGNKACEYHLGVDESEKNKVSVFPNPSQGKIELLSDIPLKNIKVVNVIGSTLKEIRTDLTLKEIDLSELPQGTYYLNIENADGEYAVKVIQLSGK